MRQRAGRGEEKGGRGDGKKSRGEEPYREGEAAGREGREKEGGRQGQGLSRPPEGGKEKERSDASADYLPCLDPWCLTGSIPPRPLPIAFARPPCSPAERA